MSRLGRYRHLTYPVELRACRDWGGIGTSHTLWRLRACRDWGGIGTSHTLWRLRACRDWGGIGTSHTVWSSERVEIGAVSAPHIPCGAQSVSRLGRYRHLTYPLEAQSVSRLGRSRHITYPVELRTCRDWGGIGTAHTVWSSERVESGAVYFILKPIFIYILPFKKSLALFVLFFI